MGISVKKKNLCFLSYLCALRNGTRMVYSASAFFSYYCVTCTIVRCTHHQNSLSLPRKTEVPKLYESSPYDRACTKPFPDDLQ